jgi:hypothetical protein
MWDNERISQYIVNDNDRLERYLERFQAEENREYEMPFVTVPNDYGKHEKSLYFGGYEDERGNH